MIETEYSFLDSDIILNILWGSKNGYVANKIYAFSTPIANQPLLLDVNSDMIVDLFVTTAKSKKRCLLMS